MSNYVGNKGGQGIREQIINHVPLSKRYFSLFYGQGGFENCHLVKNTNWLCSEKNHDLQSFSTRSASIVENNYQDLIVKYNFTSEDFIFADPPYKFSTRRSGRKYYKHEFSDVDHIKFLNYAVCSEAKWLITHPQCDLYNNKLKSWFKIPMRYQTRQGWFEDCIWLNYDSWSIELLNYDCLGNDFVERQQVKRKRSSIVRKIKNLPFHQQQAIFKELNKASV